MAPQMSTWHFTFFKNGVSKTFTGCKALMISFVKVFECLIALGSGKNNLHSGDMWNKDNV